MKNKLFLLGLVLFFFLFYSQIVEAQCSSCDGIQVCDIDYCCDDTVRPSWCTAVMSPYGDCICPTDYGDWTAAGCNDYCTTDDYDCCSATACGGGTCWNRDGWLGDINDNCCGDSPGENYKVCDSNDTIYKGFGSDVCTISTIDTACCDSASDCVFNGACYNTGTEQDIDSDGLDEYCISGNWTAVPDGLPCDNGKECINYCVDVDYNGIFEQSTDRCGSCDANLLSNNICGAIADNGSVYGMCTGAAGFYECQDQSNTDGNGFCVGNIATCLENDPAAGGYMGATTQGRNYIRCDSKNVCDGSSAITWATGSAENIAGGNCVSVDTVDGSDSLSLQDDDSGVGDSTIGLSDALIITSSYTYANPTPSPPSWYWVSRCLINDTIYTNFCHQNPTSSFEELKTDAYTPGQTIQSGAIFSPTCDPLFLGSYNVSLGEIYAGSCNENYWQSDALSLSVLATSTFNVLECEDKEDAIMVENYNHGYTCIIDGGCGNTTCLTGSCGSYCNASYESTPCPTNLDNTTGCASANETVCCGYYGFDWGTEGETTNFGEYGDNLGNKDLPNPDNGDITLNISECCGDDLGEEYVNPVIGDPLNERICCDNPDDHVWSSVCHDDCYKEECNYTNPSSPDCTGVCEDSSCYDGIDNDDDGTVDFCQPGMIGCPVDVYDTDCMGTIQGYVYNQSSGLPLENAYVRVVQKQPLVYFGNFYNYTYSTYTDATGFFSVVVNGDPGEGRAFDVVAGKEFFEPETFFDAKIGYQETFTINFYLEQSSSPCRSDCTKGDGLCYAECDLWSGCYYYDETAKNLCDGKQPGFRVPYGPDQIIECCNGAPISKPTPAVEKGKRIIVQKKDFVRITRPVIMDGETVNMIIDVFW